MPTVLQHAGWLSRQEFFDGFKISITGQVDGLTVEIFEAKRLKLATVTWLAAYYQAASSMAWSTKGHNMCQAVKADCCLLRNDSTLFDRCCFY